MPCQKPNIPKYLHFDDDKPKYKEIDFRDEHLLYRTDIEENPVSPPHTIAGYSCKWSFIMLKEDILKTPPYGHNTYTYATVKEIKDIKIVQVKTEGENQGEHILSCIIRHEPTECDYSHSEILIKHIIKDKEGNITENIYSSENWSRCLLKKNKSDFYSDLRSEYKRQLIKIFYHTD